MANDGTTRITIEAEYFRYLTTLSSGAIVVLTVFVEKLFANPVWKLTAVLAFFAFLLSAIASAAAYTVIVIRQEPLTGFGTTDNIKISGVIATFAALLMFILGLLFLILFAARNI
jgi:hypothetical protein